MPKSRHSVAVALTAAVLVAGAFGLWRTLRPLWPAFGPVLERTPVPGRNDTGIPLSVPDGFGVTVLADGLDGARVLAEDGSGNLYVSRPADGMITVLAMREGRVDGRSDFLTGLRHPHGIAIREEGQVEALYIAEEHRISRMPLGVGGVPEFLADLPEGGRHINRTLAFGSDGRLYISIGSSCNVCDEEDPLRGTIQVVDTATGSLTTYARGLRNAPFFVWHPATRELWATEMGRDHLGDDLPPDEINIVREGRDYGWPRCYGARVHDADFDTRVYVRDPCADTEPAYVELPAHVAPLGLAFIPRSWPPEYRGDLLVAMHGSWNRSEPVGYGILRVGIGPDGAPGGQEPFISGWLEDDSAYGRPVDLLFSRDGRTLYVSDDKAGAIYAVQPLP